MGEEEKYFLKKKVIGQVPRVEIDQKFYNDLVSARSVLTNAFEIEEKYEVLIQNYIDFEKQLLDIALSSMVRNPVEYYDFFLARTSVNVRLLNLLTTARLYLDSVHRHAGECCGGKEKAKTEINNYRRAQFESNPEYRFMESLRNYVQHYNMPVDWIQHNNKRTSMDDDWQIEFSTEVASMKSNLEEDADFKKKVLEELDEKIDLKVAVKSYVESLSAVHNSVREYINDAVVEARGCIESATEMYADVHDGSMIGLYAGCWIGEEMTDGIVLTLEWDDIRLKLVQRNRQAVNLKKRYVTGDIKSDNNKR